MLLGVVPAAEHVFKAALGGDRFGGLEPHAGVRDQANPGEDLIRLDHDMVAALDPLDPRRTVAERPIEAGLAQIGLFEHVRVGRENQRQHRHLLSLTLYRGQQLWQPARRRQACPGAGRGGARLVMAGSAG